jgi:hypothetical protein
LRMGTMLHMWIKVSTLSIANTRRPRRTLP